MKLWNAKIRKLISSTVSFQGEKHSRVGTVLACLADVYTQRGIKKGESGDVILVEVRFFELNYEINVD
jgi:hypothetical protein